MKEHELLYGKFARARSVDTSFEKMRKDTYDAHLRGLQSKIIKSFDRARDNHNEILFGKTYYDRKTRRKLLPGCNVYLLKDARKGNVAAYSASSTSLEHRLVQAASGSAPSVEV